MSNSISSVCVYCGSRPGKAEHYTEMATVVGEGLARRGIQMVFGAGSVGLMGIAARAAMKAGGHVTGIIPAHLDDIEVTQPGLDEIHITDNMHDRKRMMFDRSDAFVILPGGLGTLDEMMEIITWSQLSLHKKPILLLNHNGYWDHVLALFDHIVEEGFAAPTIYDLFDIAQSPDDLFSILEQSESGNGSGRSDLL